MAYNSLSYRVLRAYHPQALVLIDYLEQAVDYGKNSEHDNDNHCNPYEHVFQDGDDILYRNFITDSYVAVIQDDAACARAQPHNLKFSPASRSMSEVYLCILSSDIQMLNCSPLAH